MIRTGRRIRFFQVVLLFLTPFGMVRARQECAPAVPIEQAVDRALFHLVTNPCLKSQLDLGSGGDLSAVGTGARRE
jgi:hypothetical protein